MKNDDHFVIDEENETVDKILLINVIYFLNPIKEYLSEFERILKMNGTILITGKFGSASKMDQSVFKNTDLNGLLSILENFKMREVLKLEIELLKDL